MLFSRRAFIMAAATGLASFGEKKTPKIMTIYGLIPADQMGKTLIHEHFLVDFIGAEKISYSRWNRSDVLKKVLPYLQEVKRYGVKTIFDCTPAFLGRDVELLKMVSDKGRIQIVTNTGYYGAAENKYLPANAFTETAEQLARRWIAEFEKGIEGSSVRPGFIKIGVNPGPLSTIHQKLLKAAALAHKATGLTICSHTGPAIPAMEQIRLLSESGVDPSVFVWVHAQSEKDKYFHQKAATLGSWVSLDGIGWGDFNNYADSLDRLKSAGLLHRVLISHDAGWYKPGEPGAFFAGYTNIFTQLLPVLQRKGFKEHDFHQILVTNPANAFALK